MTTCTTIVLPSTQWDHACFDKKPFIKYCHIPAFNGNSGDPHFSFTQHSYFTADTAHKTCEKIGGKVPDLNNKYDAFFLMNAIEYLSSFVRFGRPFSLRWTSWPVRTEFVIEKLVIINKINRCSMIMSHIFLNSHSSYG